MYQSRDKGLDNLYCGKWRKILKSRHDLDLGQTMPNIELPRAIFTHYKKLKFQVDLTIIFSYRVHRHTNTLTDT